MACGCGDRGEYQRKIVRESILKQIRALQINRSKCEGRPDIVECNKKIQERIDALKVRL